MKNPLHEHRMLINRRQFFGRTATGAGALALSQILTRQAGAEQPGPHFAPKAKRIIYLFQSGGPSQLDLFDHKPGLKARYKQELPESVRGGQRLTGMSSGQASHPVAPSIFNFEQHGQSGAWVSNLMPHTAGVVDELCFIKTMHTDHINHDPAITFFQTGFQLAGRPSFGSWLSYGLGSENENLPAFVAMSSGRVHQPLYARLWGNGFLPGKYQGVKFRGAKDPVLHLRDPSGIDAPTRRRILDDIAALNETHLAQYQDPEIAARIAQYELAYRMQTSVPELADVSAEPPATFDLYGADAKKPGTYAANCLLARRLVERGVRCVQLFHMGWDQHGGLPSGISGQCKATDQATAGLITDLKQRGLLKDTLVVWGGEFGRTVYSQGALSPKNYGRDHHPRCFTMWLAGGGVKPGMTYGETDDFSYNIATPDQQVHVHDLHATLLHLMGIDHTRLTYKFQGRHYRLTDVHGKVVKPLLA